MNFKNNGNEKQRFSLRKLNCGLVSVLVGMAFFGPVAFSIEADGEKSATTETVVQKSAQQTTQDQNIVETTTRSETTEEVTTTSQTEETQETKIRAKRSAEEGSKSKADGFTLTVKSPSHPDHIITNNGQKIQSVITIGATAPKFLSPNAELRMKYWSNDPHEIINLWIPSNTEGQRLFYLNAPSPMDKVKDPTVMYTGKISVGELKSGSAISINNTVVAKFLSQGQTYNVTYELVDNDEVITSVTETFTAKLPDPQFLAKKYTQTEYLTSFDSNGKVRNSAPLPFSVVQHENYNTGLIEKVTLTVPEGFKITEDSKKNGWKQVGNTVVRDHYYYDADVIPNSSFGRANLGEGYAKMESFYTNVYTSGLSFDTSAYGTVEELSSPSGKTWTITSRVDTLDEMGYKTSQTFDTSGVLRAQDSENSVASASVTSYVNDLKEYNASDRYPTEDFYRDEIIMDEDDYASGKSKELSDIVIKFDEKKTVGKYRAIFHEIQGIDVNLAALKYDEATFDVYSLDDPTQKITSVHLFKYTNLTLPENISGIILRPTGKMTQLSAAQAKGLRIFTRFQPTSEADLPSKAPVALFHTISMGDGKDTSITRYQREEIVFHTQHYWGTDITNSSTPFTSQQIAIEASNYKDNSNRLVKLKYDDVVDKANAMVTFSVPPELTMTLKTGETLSGGTYTRLLSDFVENGFDANLVWRFDFQLKPTSPDVKDGRYDLYWYLTWGTANEEVKENTYGKYPIPGDEETTKNVKTYTISNNLMFGSQTRVSNKTGYYTSDKADVETDVDFTIQTTLINTFDSSLTGGIGIQYLPRKGIENSTYDVLLTGPVTPAPEFKVQYTVDTPTRDRSQDNDQLTWTDSVSDYSKVTAVRFVQTGSTFPNYNDFYLPVKTTDPLKVEDVAYTQVGLKATQFEKFIMSNPIQMTPRIWTEDFVLIDKNGNKLWNLAQQKTATKKFVAFTDEEFPGVRYIRSSEYSSGNVIHFYVPTGSVKVNYQDEAGNPIKDSVVDTLNAPEGNLYDTTEHKLPLIKTDEGKLYDLLPDATKGTEKGEVEKGETEVTYVYKERAKGEVVVKYVIEGTSNEIKDAVTDTSSTYISDENGTVATYDTTDHKPSTITKDGKEYQLVDKVVPNEKGNLTEGTTTITYEYKLVTGTVTVKYEDENGQPIKEDNVITPADTPKGTPYDTTPNRDQEIVAKDGKTYELSSETPKEGADKISGIVLKGNTDVTYVYREVKTSITIQYVDEDGNILQDKVEKKELSTGEKYDTTSDKPVTITKDGILYTLIPTKTQGEETGTTTKKPIEVTYVYHKTMTTWVDTNGKELRPSKDGQHPDTKGTHLPGYKLVSTTTKENGDVVNVYRQLTTIWVDTDNNVLKPKEDGEKEQGNIEGYDYVKTVVDDDGNRTHIFKKHLEETTNSQSSNLTSSNEELPNTGTGGDSVFFGSAAISALMGLGLLKSRKKEEEEGK
ncbi:MucBP domain-containing protein [uncultured Granulicatella sp.]|uniref:MucBP domain-containing protein n=1 Tax=uncultured Granulicatella sp. TaxID=316089 RepID=UPI002618AC6F|nr:MucBP domain-containing protein [uncultured Granulicatella sp.]